MSLYNYGLYLLINFIVFTKKLYLAITGTHNYTEVWYLYSKIAGQFYHSEEEMVLKQGQRRPEISLEDKQTLAEF